MEGNNPSNPSGKPPGKPPVPPARPPALPPAKPGKTWEQEKEEMRKVIEVQSKFINALKAQNDQFRDYIEKMKQKDGSSKADSLEEEFCVSKEDVRFCDIGGLDHVMYNIMYFKHSIDHPQLFEMYAERPPRGLILYGPPGCGKTTVAKAMSNELNCYFLPCPITMYISKWVGEAEKTLEAVLKKAVEISKKEKRKVMLFVDEAEQTFRQRGLAHDSGVSDKCVSVWLRYMDGFEEADGLIFVAATNRIDMVDDGVLREGRFDYKIEVPKPNLAGVEEILRKRIAYRERKAERQIFLVEDYRSLAELLYSRGASGADIDGVVKKACYKKIRELIETPAEELVLADETLIGEIALRNEILSRAPSQSNDARKIGFRIDENEQAEQHYSKQVLKVGGR